MKQRFLQGIVPSIAMLILILDSNTAFAGAREGIRLCVMTVLPSLFPYMVLSSMLTSGFVGQSMKPLRLLGRLCGMPKGTECLFPIGILGGYPTGARAVTQIYGSGAITKQQAEHLLSFCSNAGPSFLFGICGQFFDQSWMVWLLWGVHILSAIAVGMCCSHGTGKTVTIDKLQMVPLPEAIDKGIRTTARVCGCVILFRIIIAYVDKLNIAGSRLSLLLAGILELTNGVCRLDQISNIGLRFVVASAFLSFGGICVLMQTASVTQDLGIRSYIKGKLLHCVISTVLAYLLQGLLLPAENALCLRIEVLIFLLIGLIFLRKRKKSVAFRRMLMYNQGKQVSEVRPCCSGKRLRKAAVTASTARSWTRIMPFASKKVS